MKKILFFAFAITLFCFACKKETNPDADTIASIDFGDAVKSIETLGYYSPSDATILLQAAEVPSKIELTCGLYLYRVLYKTKNFDDKEIIVSGLLGVPDTKDIKGLVSWHHGTNPDRNSAPSVPTAYEGIPISALFAGNGYISLMPDYIGLGKSEVIPNYLHHASTVSTCVDFINIGAKILNKLSNNTNKNLFMGGFSQGGCVSAAVQRALEKNNTTGLTLKGVACVAGAFDLKNISIKYAVENNSTLYLGYLANSYANIYGGKIETVINPTYVSLVRSLFDGSKSADFIIENLPTSAKELLTPTMFDALKNGTNNWLTNALEQNETYNWKPIAKIKLIYGASDIDVSSNDAISTYNNMKKLGGNVELVNVGPYDHNGSLLQALPEIQSWFNTLK